MQLKTHISPSPARVRAGLHVRWQRHEEYGNREDLFQEEKEQAAMDEAARQWQQLVAGKMEQRRKERHPRRRPSSL
jgi:hypothetical protein